MSQDDGSSVCCTSCDQICQCLSSFWKSICSCFIECCCCCESNSHDERTPLLPSEHQGPITRNEPQQQARSQNVKQESRLKKREQSPQKRSVRKDEQEETKEKQPKKQKKEGSRKNEKKEKKLRQLEELQKERNKLKEEFEHTYPRYKDLKEERVTLLEQGSVTVDLKETHKVLVEELSSYFKDHLQFLLHIKVTGDSQKDKPEGRKNSTTESDESKGEQEEVPMDEENPVKKPKDQQNEESRTRSSEYIETSQENLLIQIEDHPLEQPLPAVQEEVSLHVDNKGRGSKELYKVYGLVLSASIKSCAVYDDSSRKNEVLQKVSSKYPFITGHTEVDTSVNKALSMTWSMLTLLPPLLVTKPQCQYSEGILDTNRHTWDEDKSGPQQLYYYRPVLVYGNHLHVAIKGLVGNNILVQD